MIAIDLMTSKFKKVVPKFEAFIDTMAVETGYVCWSLWGGVNEEGRIYADQ